MVEFVNTKVYTTGDAQPAIYIGDRTMTAFVQLEPVVTGVGKVQSTINSKEDIDAGTASWVDWPNGSVSAVAQNKVEGATAIRCYRTSGELKMVVRFA